MDKSSAETAEPKHNFFYFNHLAAFTGDKWVILVKFISHYCLSIPMSKEVNTTNTNASNNVEKNVNSYINLTEQTVEKTLDSIKENMIKSIDEYVKIQPRFLQSVSDFQLEVIQSSKDVINKTIAHQKGLIKEFVNVSQAQPNETYQQLFNKTNENVDNFVKAFTAGNQFNFDAIDTTRENVKLYNKALDAFTDYSTNTFNAWTSFARSFYRNK